MRRIIIKEARPGMTVARSILHPARQQPGLALATAGETLTTSRLAQMHRLGIYDLWVDDPGLEFFEEICASQPTPAQQRLAVGLCDSFLRLSGTVSRSAFKRYDVVLEELVDSIVRTAPVVPCFAALTEDDALLAHSCDVAALSILLGLHLEEYLVEQRRRLSVRQARDILNLGLGALFHDVGELMLPAQQRESRNDAINLTGGEEGEWKQHTEEGFAIVHGRLDPSAATIVQHHHQRFDGSGFGGGGTPGFSRVQRGTGIHVYARIVMAADVFCQMGSVSGGQASQPLVKSLWRLQQMPEQQWFDPVVHQMLMRLLPPFVEGMVVTLSDRRQGMVMHVDAVNACYPEVQVIATPDVGDEEPEETPGVIMLAEHDRLAITMVDGSEVTPFLYGVRKGRPLVAA